ncbi:ABC transporter substrate-binding protein [Verticiella sediminum]|uniref:ABC transporter substrate-binding protein n=1 Tax=Verticiella sediminum TaxID=1247510 RepID=A0A556AYP6_9BURK|nr:ABC transporter substrate-binding protein [Verticiella sediminum]TSH98063.1 ABC transporter substrate-binding protein [Verticiella sediminum]
MKRRTILKLGAAAALGTALSPVLASAPRGKLTPVKFTLDFRVTSQTSPFLLALAKGYYAEEGLDVQIDVGSGSVASITRVASGAYQLGLGDISALIEFRANNAGVAPVQAIYQYYNRAPFVIIGRKDRGVTEDFRSLQGKRVAGAAVEAVRRSWPIAARRLDVPEDLFDWVTTDFSARDNVVVRGDVDAATYFHDSAVSLFARMPPEQLSILSYVDTGAHLYGNAVIANPTLLQEQPDIARAFLRASNRALRETLQDDAEAIAATLKREPMLNRDVERERWAICRQYIAGPETQRVGLGGVDPAVMQTQIESVATVFGLARTPAMAEIVTDDYLPEAGEREVTA